jgi:hypothetical protein
MTRFRKKPVEVEAWQVGSRLAAPSWLTSALEERTVRVCPHHLDHVLIDTLEGTMRASPGDWIIRGVRGELYPCRTDIFAETYDPLALAPTDQRDLSLCPDGDGGYDG